MNKKFFIFIVFILAVFASIFVLNNKHSAPLYSTDYYRGINAYHSNTYQLAQQYFTQDLKNNSNQPQTLLMAGQSFMKGKYQNFNKSIDFYKQYIAHFQGNPPLDLNLIRQLKNVGMRDELLSLSSKTNNALFKALIWENIDPDKALKNLKLVSANEQNIEYYLLAVRVYSKHRLFDKVILNANKAIELSGMHKNNYYLLSQAYRSIQEFDNAKKTLTTFKILSELESEKSSEKQLALLNKLINLNQNLLFSNDFNSFYITVLINLNYISEAKEKLLEFDISSLNSQHKIPILSAIYEKNEIDLALLILKNSNPKTIEDGESVVYCKIATNNIIAFELFAACENAVNVHEHSAPLLYWYGVNLLNKKNITEGRKKIAKAINLAPWIDSWIIHLSNLYLLEGKVESAKKTLNQSISNSQKIKQFRISNSLF